MILAIAASVVVAPVPKEAEFGQWVVACDNGLRCEAAGLPDDGEQNGWVVLVSREAAGTAAPTGVFVPAYGDDPPAEFVLRMDGRPMAVRGTHFAKALRSLAAARKVEVVDGKGAVIGTVPVTGASAALRYMDDRQKRAGTVTAVIEGGSRPASNVPRPPALPTIRQPAVSKKPPRKLSAAEIRKIQDLGDGFCEHDRSETTTHRLDAMHSVGLVDCIMGAYQGSSLVVVIDEQGKWQPARIEQTEPPNRHFSEPYDEYLLTSVYYDDAGRLLRSDVRGRGMYDCGYSSSWAWDGRMFRLAAHSELSQCKGAPPGTGLSRWRTTNDPGAKE